VIDIGYKVNGLTVAAYFDPEFHWQNPAFWMACARGHRTFATVQQIESGAFSCQACKTEDTVHAVRQDRNKLADDMIAAGRENESAFEALVEADRAERDAQMLRRIL
jgi:hypothetical protein